MTSEQKYEGKGNFAQNPSQTVETRRYAPLSPDERSAMINQFEKVQTDLLSLVDDFASIENGLDPVSAISGLLQNLLSNPATELVDSLTRNELKAGLMLISFLSEARLLLFKRGVVMDALEFGKEVKGE